MAAFGVAVFGVGTFELFALATSGGAWTATGDDDTATTTGSRAGLGVDGAVGGFDDACFALFEFEGDVLVAFGETTDDLATGAVGETTTGGPSTGAGG